MIEIPQPAMVMNSHNVPPPDYKMTNSYKVGASHTPTGMLGNAARVFKEWKEKDASKTLTLIINCHGIEYSKQGGYGLSVGTGIYMSDVIQFEKIAPYVDRIYITACQAARITNPGSSFGDGNLLMGAIAKAANAEVVCSTANQYAPPKVPFGHIDDYEGTVLVYGPKGNVLGSADF
jgi:hypothetical protein